MTTYGGLVANMFGASGAGMAMATNVVTAAMNGGSKFGEMGSDSPQQSSYSSKTTSYSSSRSSSVSPRPTIASQIISIFCTIFAIYLAYKCSTKLGKLPIVDIIAAICCSPCYVAYRLVKPC